MKNEFIPYEEALALKELGFDEKCYGYYTEYRALLYFNEQSKKDYFYFDVDDLSSAYTKNMDNLIVNSVDDLECTAPLYQQAFRWFREKYNLYFPIISTYTDNSAWSYNDGQNNFDTYEEAELACLNKLIEISKPKEDEEND